MGIDCMTKDAVATGASTGIGRGAVKVSAQHGRRVVAGSRKRAGSALGRNTVPAPTLPNLPSKRLVDRILARQIGIATLH
jgi:NAD(P)-dependent dehydrogenase (short-subunit alcohol dehydrogenase family)